MNDLKSPGFSGTWYGNQPTDPPYHWKYSGGLATYPQQHAPIAIYRAEAHRTYFVYGGAGERPADATYLPQGREVEGTTDCCIAYFDHASGRLARPITVLTRDVIDAHENPVLSIDPSGHLLVFCPSHGSSRPSFIYRSARPHDIHAFELVRRFEPGDNFSYPQPWWLDERGLVFLHTFYEQQNRRLGVTLSPDGVRWPEWKNNRYLSRIASGGYQISWPRGDGLLATAFDMHPVVAGDGPDARPLNHRTNIYYVQSADGGKSWQTATGQPLDMPLTEIDNPALVYDAQADGLLVYLKDLQFDPEGRPILLYVTSRGAWPRPDAGPRRWWLARFNGRAWSHHPITESDHNYDHGSLLLLGPDDWRLIAPTTDGPQRYATGGTMTLWRSNDRGLTWHRAGVLIRDDARNHTYARRPLDAHAGFAMLWAAADAHHPQPAELYFCDADGQTFRMPPQVTRDFVHPEPMGRPVQGRTDG